MIDFDGVYDFCCLNDWFLLGMKGSISEFELGVIWVWMVDVVWVKV